MMNIRNHNQKTNKEIKTKKNKEGDDDECQEPWLRNQQGNHDWEE
jgi:hypothetical protein